MSQWEEDQQPPHRKLRETRCLRSMTQFLCVVRQEHRQTGGETERQAAVD